MGDDVEKELAARDARHAARLLAGGTAVAGAAAVGPSVSIAVVLLGAWSRDGEVRSALRPLFEAAVPDQRALIALGDIDIWLPGGHQARRWWLRAADGPDPELAGLGAWHAAQADLRGGRPEDALPLLRQADAAGVAAASFALGRLLEDRGDDGAADAYRRSRSNEGRLRLAELRLRADDTCGAERALEGFSLPYRAREVDLGAWEDRLQGEIHFRRGRLRAAEGRLERSVGHPRVDLRLAQIAIAEGRAGAAYLRTTRLAEGPGDVADQARLLLELHAALMAEGARRVDERVDDEEEEEE